MIDPTFTTYWARIEFEEEGCILWIFPSAFIPNEEVVE